VDDFSHHHSLKKAQAYQKICGSTKKLFWEKRLKEKVGKK